MQEEDYMSLKEACRVWGNVSRQTYYNWRNKSVRDLPQPIQPLGRGGELFFKRSEVEAFRHSAWFGED